MFYFYQLLVWTLVFGPRPQPQIACFAHMTQLCCVSNIQPQKLMSTLGKILDPHLTERCFRCFLATNALPPPPKQERKNSLNLKHFHTEMCLSNFSFWSPELWSEKISLDPKYVFTEMFFR